MSDDFPTIPDDFPTVPDDFADFDAILSLTDPVNDYKKIVNEKLMVKDLYLCDEMKDAIMEKLDDAVRDVVWKLLFGEQNPTEEALDKVGTLLKAHRAEAVVYFPFEYNEWIILLRDELLKREMLDFWKNVIVAKELGPAWARDSDYFDDMSDPEPAAFYNFGGCVAPWLQ